jgi:glycosyltransferase involved in cell wall biosynthesis
MSSARLSYIVTVFNKRPWIADLAARIIAQDAGPVEVVFVDDHSTDGSQEETERACASLRAAGHDARHIRLAENCGPAVATNVGIRCALGEWLFFIDADDMVAPGAANMMLGLAAACDADFIYAGKAPFTTELPPPVTGAQATVFEDALGGLVASRKLGQAVACRKEIAAASSDERIFIQDISLPLRAARKSKRLVYLTAPTILYRQTSGSITSDHSLQNEIDFMGAIAFFLHDGGLPREIRIRLLQRCLRRYLNNGRRSWKNRTMWWLSLLRIPARGAEAHLVREFQNIIAKEGLRFGAPGPDAPVLREPPGAPANLR